MEKELKVFSTYRPMARFRALPHPEKLVETSILSSVTLEEVNQRLSLLLLIDTKNPFLSGPQLESVLLACKAHSKFLFNGIRQGFILGDGAGVGKGRQIAAMILENWLHNNKKALWLSASRDLIVDAKRDIKEVNQVARADIHVMEAPKDFDKIENEEGVLFVTYSLLSSRKHKVTDDSPLSKNPKTDLDASKTDSNSSSDSDDVTLDSNSSKYESEEEVSVFTSRMDQIIDWLGQNYEGLIILDESHKAKGYKPKGNDSRSKSSACGMAVHELQDEFPLAKVVYVSATLATHPDDIIYMERSGLWGMNTAFPTVLSFTKALESRGIAALEHLPVELKERGIYLSRHISMDDIKFNIKSINLENGFEEIYEESCSLWHLMFKLALIVMDKKKMGSYFAECQRFFRSLCVSSKLNGAVELTRDAVSQNKSVIIGIQSTGEAAYMRYRSSKFHSTSIPFSNAEMILEDFLIKHLKISPAKLGLSITKNENEPTHYSTIAVTQRKLIKAKRFNERKETEQSRPSTSKATDENSQKLKFIDSLDISTTSLNDAICDLFKSLKEKLPANPLDELIDKLGGFDKVIELTGRVNCQKISRNKDGIIHAINVKRDSTRSGLNLHEQKRFQKGEADIVIISEAASTGISLHSSRTFTNQKQRLHIMVEFPWSASSALQQIGRTNRSNQAMKPEYIILISKIPCEKRFATAVGQRMASMGAMTKGDRRSASSDVWGKFDLDHKLAKKAIMLLITCITGKSSKLTLFLDSEDHQNKRLLYVKIFEKMDLIKIADNDKISINSRRGQFETFMNRILACPIEYQEQIIEWFNLALLRTQGSENDNDDGSSIKDLTKLVAGTIKAFTVKKFILPDGHACNFKIFNSVHGTDYETLVKKIVKPKFYKKVSIGLVGKESVIAIEKLPFKTDPNRYSLKVYNPSSSLPSNHPASFINDPTLHEISQNEAKMIWMQQYSYMARGICENQYRFGIICSANSCNHPRSTKQFGIISGGCLNIWDHINGVLNDQITLVKGQIDKTFHVGIFVPHKEIEKVESVIKIICERKEY